MNVKLNLDFSLYKGVTKLKQWYKEVKAHFTQVQEAHNDLQEQFDTHAAIPGYTTISGHVKLSDGVNQTFNAGMGVAATPLAVKQAYDKAVEGVDAASAHKTAEVLDHPDKSVTRIKLAADVTGEMDGLKAEHGNLKETVDTHKTAAVLDHPDKSVTTGKIADRSITLGKLSLDIQDEIAKIPEFLYYDVDPIYLSGCKESLGYELPADIPVNALFILENDTDSSLSEFRTHDDYYTPLSCKIPSGETRICILLKRASGGAAPQNGYLFVLDDTETKHLIDKETLERKNADNSLQQKITAETTARETADTALEEKINYFISLRPTDREIFVMCNGDHDELKIQAALDAVKTGGIVYPVGEVVVLTNANTNKGYSPITTYDVVLKIGSNKTLDFRFCEGVMFNNTNPGNNQAIFQLSQRAQLKNLWEFYESTDTCTTESINPTVLYTADYCIVDNCNFDTIQGMNTTAASQHLFKIGQYCKFRNNTLNGISLNNITTMQRGFDFGTGTVVENNLFQNITSLRTAAKVFYFTKCNVEKNTFTTFDLGGNAFYISSGFVNNNRFFATNNTYFRFGGIVKGNTFASITANEHDTTFLADGNSNVVDNTFAAITANDSYALVTVNNNATFSNKMYNITPPTNSTAVIDLYEGAILKESTVKIKDISSHSDVVIAADQEGYSLINDNITNAASMGYIDSSSVLEGNIVGFGA